MMSIWNVRVSCCERNIQGENLSHLRVLFFNRVIFSERMELANIVFI